MTMVLVHGGGLGKECWDRMLPYLDGDVLAVDLPGRGDRPADLSTIGIADFVDAVVDDIVSARPPRRRARRPLARRPDDPAGRRTRARPDPRFGVRVLHGSARRPEHATTRSTPRSRPSATRARDDELTTLDPEIATAVFYNDVTDPAVLEWGLSLLVPEAPASVTDPMVLASMPRDIRRVWIRLNDDHIVVPEKQDRFIENLGGCEVLELDAGHMAMVSRPQDLARLAREHLIA